MFQHIVVPLDSSTGSEHAIPVAARLARASGGGIVFVHVVSSLVAHGASGTEHVLAGQPNALEKHLTEAEHYLARVTHRYASELSGIHVEQEVALGSASSTLLSVARQEKNDLIVLSSHRSHGLFHWVLGGIAHEALRQSPVPLLLLNEVGGVFLESCPERSLRILIALDGSLDSEAALQPALQLASGLAAPVRSVVHLLQVVDLSFVDGKTPSRAYEIRDEQMAAWKKAEIYLQEVAHHLREQMLEESCPVITWSVRSNTDSAGTIVSVADPSDAVEPGMGYDLIAMASHGQSRLQRLMLGSVTERVLSATRLPLFIVRPSQTEAQHGQAVERPAHDAIPLR